MTEFLEGAKRQINLMLDNLGEVQEAWIFGSLASGHFGDNSDIDLLVVGAIDEDSLLNATGRLEAEWLREVNYVLYTPEEFRRLKERGLPFLKSVYSQPRIILRTIESLS